MARIAIIGGGSAYMPGLAFSFAHESQRFAGSTLVLHDIDADALDVQRRLTGSILRAHAAAPLEVTSTGDLQQALDGADFVLTSFRPGGLEARHRDESIPPEYGVIGQETTGPGGLAMAMRSIPTVLEIAAGMRRGAADGALLLNYTNPVQLVTDALVRHGGVNAIGRRDRVPGRPARRRSARYGDRHLGHQSPHLDARRSCAGRGCDRARVRAAGGARPGGRRQRLLGAGGAVVPAVRPDPEPLPGLLRDARRDAGAVSAQRPHPRAGDHGRAAADPGQLPRAGRQR